MPCRCSQGEDHNPSLSCETPHTLLAPEQTSPPGPHSIPAGGARPSAQLIAVCNDLIADRPHPLHSSQRLMLMVYLSVWHDTWSPNPCKQMTPLVIVNV